MGAIRRAVVNAFLPWTASVSGDVTFELYMMCWFVAFVLLRRLVLLLPPSNQIFRELVQRPTVVPVMLHSLVCTIVAMAAIVPPGEPSATALPMTVYLWRRAVLSFSCAYWLFDLAFYCYPKGDLLIAVHHIAIFICSWPVGDDAGASALAMLNPQCNVVMCSVNGYALEATTFLLYARWLLANTLNAQHWVYSAISALLLVSWVFLRLLYSPYFLLVHMLPSCSLSSPIAFYALTGYATYTLMILMSAVWLMQLLKNGIRAFLVLEESASKKIQNAALISFGARRKRA